MVLQAGVPKAGSLSGLGRAWRLGAVVGALGLLVYGSAWGSDDQFPFGPMSQYSFRIDPDGEVRALWVEADLADGSHRRLDISDADDVGVARAELEGQLDRIIADPQRLSTLAEAWVRLHPDRPELRRIVVGQDVVELSAGREAGHRTDVFTTWNATPVAGLTDPVPR
ncbi:MAG TPA: hypothetical protein VMZ00_13980 [Sporichthya sp.]|nr:hypothetical protein [Sporichthya sp.]